jgi:autotransporter adhesin
MTSAMSALVPNGRSAKNTQVSLGLGTYEGESAFAIGAFHYVDDDILLNAAVSHSPEAGTAARAGITWGF